ncbi:uncharacterized protein LOC111264858 [Varroa jacobsoni]|nr:uncharacterized protein LOC111243414 isoform X2 [Varroa destructor]XP_022644680.1 uncharacterized protein LOC111243414 isoform X2 [Varroa destructor]XP_022696817.1 uncharacterized protein LOC111264858 [Varroa jacobsoni]
MRAYVTLFVGVTLLAATVTAAGEEELASARETKSVKVARSPRIEERRYKFHNSMNKNSVGASSEAVELKAQQEVSKFMNTRNLIKTAIKLVFGSDEESAATSRQILNLLVTVLDMVKTTFGARARAAHQGRGLNGALDDITIAGASMMKGLLKSAMAKDENCMQRFLCEASKDAVKEGHELGYLVAQFGGYAASYALERQKNLKFDFSYNATRSGRSGDDCFTLYQTCNEAV